MDGCKEDADREVISLPRGGGDGGGDENVSSSSMLWWCVVSKWEIRTGWRVLFDESLSLVVRAPAHNECC